MDVVRPRRRPSREGGLPTLTRATPDVGRASVPESGSCRWSGRGADGATRHHRDLGRRQVASKLTELVCRLPSDLPAAVFIVLHVPPDGTSVLPTILNRAGTVPASHPHDGQAVQPGRITWRRPTIICS